MSRPTVMSAVGGAVVGTLAVLGPIARAVLTHHRHYLFGPGPRVTP